MLITKLYHCTSNAYTDSILEKGLLLENCRLEKPSIYLSLYPAHVFGNTCFEVNVIGLPITKLHSWEFICTVDIDPSRITYYSYEEDE